MGNELEIWRCNFFFFLFDLAFVMKWDVHFDLSPFPMYSFLFVNGNLGHCCLVGLKSPI